MASWPRVSAAAAALPAPTIASSLLGPAAMVFGFGRNGGSGGYGGEVNVYSGSSIFTKGEQSHGIFAQSIGGGGGTGGLSVTGGVSAFGGLSLSMGGDGGEGKYGGTVNVTNSGSIDTQGEYAYGIKAQSIGGGGGSGGASGSVMANFSSLIPIPDEYPTGSINIALALGGSGGTGGKGGTVNVTNNGQITTEGDFSHAIFAQSVGGGGGDGGKSIAATANISMPEGASDEEVSKQLEVKVNFAMAIGGSGGSGQTGGAVVVTKQPVHRHLRYRLAWHFRPEYRWRRWHRWGCPFDDPQHRSFELGTGATRAARPHEHQCRRDAECRR